LHRDPAPTGITPIHLNSKICWFTRPSSLLFLEIDSSACLRRPLSRTEILERIAQRPQRWAVVGHHRGRSCALSNHGPSQLECNVTPSGLPGQSQRCPVVAGRPQLSQSGGGERRRQSGSGPGSAAAGAGVGVLECGLASSPLSSPTKGNIRNIRNI
jgi:hypothetical protein